MSTPTTPTTAAAPRTAVAPSTTQKVGLAIGILHSLDSLYWAFFPAERAGETGPPIGVVAIDVALGVVGLVACLLAWRGSRRALRVAAVALSLVALTGLPGMFVDTTMPLKALVATTLLTAVLAVVLMFSAPRRPAG